MADLIRLTETHVVSPRQIASAWRCGNYTHVTLLDSLPGCPEQIWDENKTVWNAIEAAASPLCEQREVR